MSGAVKHCAVVWSVAGSDSSAGAGVQADLRAFDAFEVHGCTAVAALTAQNSLAVERIEPVSPEMLDAQLAALASDMPPSAIKTGMLGSKENLHVLVRWIDVLRMRNPALPVVVDPVLRASTGASLANDDLLRAYREALLPRATLITPNRREAAMLLAGDVPESQADVERAAGALLAMACKCVVITGGDAAGDRSEDYAAAPHASGWLSLPRVSTAHNHGTGCIFASSAAAAMARGFVEIDSIILAKMATTQALRDGYAAGRGAGPARPGAGFALDSDNLPHFSIPGQGAGLDFAAPINSDLGLYAIVDSAAWVQRVLRAGVRTVQLRIKNPAQATLHAEVRASITAARAVHAQLFINDHWEVALEEGAYGVHLGQDDLATADLAALARAGLRLGVSTHAYWEVCRAWALKPSYIACGPIHRTQAKQMPWLSQGNANLAYWCDLLPVQVVAIGGMDAQRATEAMQAGADGVAVISAITTAQAPEESIGILQQAIQEGLKARRRNPPTLPEPTLHRNQHRVSLSTATGRRSSARDHLTI